MSDTNVVMGVYFTRKFDFHHNVLHQHNDYDYIRPWYESLVRLKLNGILFHDNLANEFVERYLNPQIRFVKVDIGHFTYSAYLARFIVYYEYLSKNRFEKVLMTDVSDVVLRKDPFDFIRDEDTLYVGSEKMKAKESRWCKRRFPKAFKKYPYWMELLLYPGIIKSPIYPYWNETILNCGILGGYYGMITEFLKHFKALIDEKKDILDDREVNDMPLFNYLIYRDYPHRFVTGFPLHSVFKEYDADNSEVYIVHR